MRYWYRVKQSILLGGDVASFLFGLWASLGLRYLRLPTEQDIALNIGLFLITFGFWIVINFVNGLYDIRFLDNTKRFYRHLFESAFASLLASVLFFYLIPSAQITPKTILVLNIVIGYGFMALWRYIYNTVIGSRRFQTNVIFVGLNDEVKELIDILKRKQTEYTTVALIDPDLGSTTRHFDHTIEVYRGLKTIRPAITNHHANLVVIAPHLRQNPEALRELYELLFWHVEISDLSTFYEIITGRIPPLIFSESWFLDHLRNTERPMYDKCRVILDYLVGSLGGLLFLIFCIPIAILIRLSSPGPVLIRQQRIGECGRPFVLYKFRSMYALSAGGMAETSGVEFAKKDDKRVTSVGKFLRKTRLDELPQFWNILKRDITLIGPRPERPEIVEQLEARMPYYPLRHIIKPGLTGWAVIHQNYTDTLETSLQKLQYDLFYIKNRSLLLDISIVLRTMNILFRMRGQ